MKGSPDSGHQTIDAELQIDEVHATNTAETTVIVRCIRGPVRRGARFHQIRGATEAIDLELTQIVFYGRPVQELDPAHTALVTLAGAGMRHLVPGTLAAGWQVIQGTNPTP